MKASPPVHPGKNLREDFLLLLGLSDYRLALDLGVPPRRINEIVKGRRALTADTGVRLARYFTWPTEIWLNLQSDYDRAIAEESMQPRLKMILPCPALSGSAA